MIKKNKPVTMEIPDERTSAAARAMEIMMKTPPFKKLLRAQLAASVAPCFGEKYTTKATAEMSLNVADEIILQAGI
jgi:hypothetical protein